ncbi:hypothetical protein H6775_02820 [Candidatus Nomurabacteria bacterium]|nr:hypothetical protein [Candidatus Nomurabacteria bacterium]
MDKSKNSNSQSKTSEARTILDWLEHSENQEALANAIEADEKGDINLLCALKSLLTCHEDEESIPIAIALLEAYSDASPQELASAVCLGECPEQPDAVSVVAGIFQRAAEDPNRPQISQGWPQLEDFK